MLLEPRGAFSPGRKAWVHGSTWRAVGCKEFALAAGGTGAGRVSGVLHAMKSLGPLIVKDG